MKLTRSQWLLVLLGGAVVLRMGVDGLQDGGAGLSAEAPSSMQSSGIVSWAEASETPEAVAQAATRPGLDVNDILAGGCDMPDILLETIKEEQALLEATRAQLDEQAAEVALREETLTLQSARLQELRDELSGLLERTEAAQNADLDRLVALYTAMKPGDAARIMEDMDLEVSVMVLGSMRERDAAPILAGLSDIRARAISKIILERAQLPGDQDLTGIRLR